MHRVFALGLVVLATGALAGCPGPRRPLEPPPQVVVDDTALRIRIARAEARRGGGLDELIELAATHGDGHARSLALRGLGRIGGARAIAALQAALAESDPAIVGAAAGALGVAATLDEPDPAAMHAAGAALAAALPRAGATRPVVIEALGRAGDPSVQVIAIAQLADPDSRVREAAATALGRYGRRKLALAPQSRAAIVAATRDPASAVRYAATWALAREHAPVDDPAVTTALRERVADPSPEVRAQAILAVARRTLVGPGLDATLEQALRDPDWRVVVEAVRALAGEGADDARRDAVAASLVQQARALEAGDAPAAHVVIEGLRLLAPHMTTLAVAAVTGIVTAATATPIAPIAPIAPITRGWLRCLGRAALARVTPLPLLAVDACGLGVDGLPAHLRIPIITELAAAKVDTLLNRWFIVKLALDHADARVRAAGIALLPALWPDSDAASRRATVATLLGALGSQDPILVGAAVEAVPTMFGLTGDAALAAQDRTALEHAIVTRARRERDPELVGGLLELIGKHAIVGGVAACRAGLDGPRGETFDSAAVRTAAARACLRALGEAAPLAPPAIASPPPVDVADVIGKRLVWRIVTTRGEIAIALHPEVAPWAVATVVALTRRHFYDGLAFHRVVPDFVVQGGDPTMSGTGGPGFAIPAEPGTLADGAGFMAGGVGMADAGRDSGGSQWFIMHARAPHLDGRYTWFGTVESGHKVANALQIGDTVIRASIGSRP